VSNAEARLKQLIAQHGGRPDPATPEQRARIEAKLADADDAVRQMIGMYHSELAKTGDELHAMGVVTMLAHSVAENRETLLTLLACAVRRLG
jgi:hypothetical protein